mmetsp:Transcript_25479/g.67260  ORF Transcript_25479/g.67260 Transcript_25479/m.67260 type:complete len:94 (+) Transcript_25479:2830-3111(+)
MHDRTHRQYAGEAGLRDSLRSSRNPSTHTEPLLLDICSLRTREMPPQSLNLTSIVEFGVPCAQDQNFFRGSELGFLADALSLTSDRLGEGMLI